MEVDEKRAKLRLEAARALPDDCPYKRELIDHWTLELCCLLMQKLFSL